MCSSGLVLLSATWSVWRGYSELERGGAEDFGGSGKERVTRGVRKVRTKDRRWRSVGGILTSLDGLSKDAGVCGGDVQAE